MKNSISYFIRSLILVSFVLQGCGNGSSLLDDNEGTDTLIPEEPPLVDPNRPSPSAGAPVITTEKGQIFDVSGAPVLARGINLQFGDNPNARINGIAAIAETGSNIIRIQLTKDTPANSLEAALNRVVENNMIAMLTYWDEDISCQDDESTLIASVDNLWLEEWLPVLAQDRFQPHLMINIASKWGPMNVFNSASYGYSTYIDTYKTLIRKFRTAGFKVPLVIDAAHCGQDHHAFNGLRAQELLLADAQENLILAVHAYGGNWNTEIEIRDKLNEIKNTGLPFLVSEFGGSGVNGESSIDLQDVLSLGAGDKALVLNLPWASDSDSAAWVHTLDAPFNLIGSTISFDVYLPDAYKKDGNLGIQLYVKDGNWVYGGINLELASNMRKNQWNHFEYTISSADDLVYTGDGFEPSTIQQVGFEIKANGKPVDITGELFIDNLTIEVGPTPEPAYSATFEADAQSWVRLWGAGDAEEGAVAQNEGALAILPTWGAGDTGIAFGIDGSVPASVDISGQITVSYDVFIPEEYSSETGLFVQTFLQDPTYKFVSLNYVAGLTSGEWNSISVTLNDVLTEANYITDGFSTAMVPQQLGVEIGGVSSAKTEAILVDNVEVFIPDGAVASTGLDYSAGFETDLEGWSRAWGAGDGQAGAVAQSGGEMVVLPQWDGSQTGIALGYDNADTLFPAIDLSSTFTFAFDVFIPSEYANETGLFLQAYMNDNSWSNFAGFAYTSIGSLNVGDWTTISITINDFASEAGFMDAGFILNMPPKRFGVELGGVTTGKTEAVRFDNVRFVAGEIAEDIVLVDTQFAAGLEGWARAWGAGEGELDAVSLTDGALSILPTWTGDPTNISVGVATASLSPAIDLTQEITVSFDIFIPNEYSSEAGLYVQPYMQDNVWSGFASLNYVGFDSLSFGQWNTLTVTLEDFVADAGNVSAGFILNAPPQRVGIEIGGITSAKTEALKVDDFRITSPPASQETEVLLDFKFTDVSEFDAFTFDFAGGTLDEAAVANAITHSYGGKPFGWLAWSWKGNSGESAVLDMSNIEGFVDGTDNLLDLTERGEQVVNGINGIAETAIEVEFE